jgi:hypothetical protein
MSLLSLFNKRIVSDFEPIASIVTCLNTVGKYGDEDFDTSVKPKFVPLANMVVYRAQEEVHWKTTQPLF